MNRNEILKNIDIDSINELIKLEAEIDRQRKRPVGAKADA